MTTRIEFGTKAEADSARKEHGEHLCSDDDRRLKTVAFASSLPAAVSEELRAGAAAGQIERNSGPGHEELTDAEKNDIGPFTGSNNYRKATAVKALLQANGVDDWRAYYDPALSVDEHRSSVLPTARQEGGGRRNDSHEARQQRQDSARSAEKAVGGQCDHARGHCENANPEACEFLSDQCGHEQQTIDEILAAAEPEPPEGSPKPSGDSLTGKQKGALKRGWNGYKGGIASVEEAIDALETEWQEAQQAARAINEIRAAANQDPIHFNRLEELQARLMDLVRQMGADCHECHADHSGHDHDVTSGDREHLQVVVEDGAAATPVGTAESEVVIPDEQRDLDGDRADDQTRFADEDRGPQDSETAATAPQNEGGMMADTREEQHRDETSTEQQQPDEFQVAEGGQDTL